MASIMFWISAEDIWVTCESRTRTEPAFRWLDSSGLDRERRSGLVRREGYNLCQDNNSVLNNNQHMNNNQFCNSGTCQLGFSIWSLQESNTSYNDFYDFLIMYVMIGNCM